MARHDYPTPVQGVSVLAPSNRPPGFAEDQLNMRSDAVRKLRRRPPLGESVLMKPSGAGIPKHTRYWVDNEGREMTAIFNDDNTINAYVGNDEKPVFVSNLDYISGDVKTTQVGDALYVLNPDRVTELSGSSARNNGVCLVNLVSALNYNEKVEFVIKVFDNAGNLAHTSVESFILIPDAGVSGDQERATAKVAENLAFIATKMNTWNAVDAAGIPVYAEAKGSSVQIWSKTVYEQVRIEIVGTQNGTEDIKVFNDVARSAEGLPLYARPRTIIEIAPDPEQTAGRYYLKAVAIDKRKEYSVGLEECTWSETVKPRSQDTLTSTRMPHTLYYKADLDAFSFGPMLWETKQSGDEDSNEAPAFVGKKITAIGYFQKRLVLASGNDISMSEVDKPQNFWKTSAIKTYVTDRIGIASDAGDVGNIKQIISHNRDLLLVADDGQFKISGTEGITPQTVSMPLTTRYSINADVTPISFGDVALMATTVGPYSGLVAYTGRENTSQDTASNLSKHVLGLIDGEIQDMVVSTNLDMVVIRARSDNTLYVLERDQQGDKTSLAWSRWELPEWLAIKGMRFDAGVLRFDCMHYTGGIGKVYRFWMHLEGEEDMYLDCKLRVPFRGETSLSFSTNAYVGHNPKAYNEAGSEVGVVFGNTVTLPEPYTGDIYVGQPYRSSYKPTRPFDYDRDGNVVTELRIVLNRWFVKLVNTKQLICAVRNTYGREIEHVFINRPANKILSAVQPFNGTKFFNSRGKPDDTEVEFYTEGVNEMNIVGIGWEGDIYRRS